MEAKRKTHIFLESIGGVGSSFWKPDWNSMFAVFFLGGVRGSDFHLRALSCAANMTRTDVPAQPLVDVDIASRMACTTGFGHRKDVC